MNAEDKKEALSRYTQREYFWSEQSLQQLGYSLNLFLTIGLAFLAYLVTIRTNYPKFKFIFCGSIEWKLVFYYSILLTVLSSVAIGIVAILIRLYDLRITRHITRIRRITMKVFSKYLPEGYLDLSKDSFFKTVFCKIKFIHFTPDTKYEDISKTFDILRKQAKIMDDATWKTHYWQIGLFTAGTILFGLSIL